MPPASSETTIEAQPSPPHEAATAPAQSHPDHTPHLRRILLIAVGLVVLLAVLWIGVPWINRAWNTVSTDDAYVNEYVTFVAPRVSGQVLHVLVEDNNRVHKGDLLIELDPEPYKVQVDIAEAAVVAAKADLVSATAATRGAVGKVRSLRFNLQHAIEQVDNQVAILRANAATLASHKASLTLAQSNFDRAAKLVVTHAVSQEDYDQNHSALLVAEAQVKEALEGVYQIRASLGLPAIPPQGKELTDVPNDIDETFSSVRLAQGQLMEAAGQLGVEVSSYDLMPKQMIDEFIHRDPQGNIDRIYQKIIDEAPAVKQAAAKLLQTERNLDQAKLNLRYCRVYAEIDGVVSRRNVNPGNNLQAGQQVMALQSIHDIWVDANFKETQLAELRIGQRVEVYADMYGGRKVFKGRISGFTMGTGSTLALLPAENATGNFVKVVQRLPVRVELDYDPVGGPLFVGLSVTPYVFFREKPEGEHAGEFLQPYLATPSAGQSSVGKPVAANQLPGAGQILARPGEPKR